MVIYSNEIQNFLSELFFSEFATNVSTPRYFKIKAKLFELDKSYINRKPGRYPGWRDMNEIQIGCYIFGYSWDGQIACIEECYKEKIKETIDNTMKNNKVIRLTENDLHNMVTEAVRVALNELDPRTYASAAEKARIRGEFDRASRFKNTAIDSWERDYGNELHADDDFRGGGSRFIDPYFYDGSESFNNAYVCNRYPTPEHNGDCYNPKRDFRMPFDKYGNKPMAGSAPQTKGERVARQMVHGDGKYALGKGWQ